MPLPRNVTTQPQTHQATLQEGIESVSGTAGLSADSTRQIMGRVPGGVIGGMVGGLPGAPPPPPPATPSLYDASPLIAAASADSMGDLFEYRIKERVTLAKNQSALVPIASATIEAEKVSVWSQGAGSGRPLRAVWLTNSTGLTLDGGSIAIIDGNAFAGEGLMASLQAGERRLVALSPVIDAQARLQSAERGAQQLTKERDAINADQARLRENMKALRGSAEEKALLQRYTRRLDDQETRLEALKGELAAASAAVDAARREVQLRAGELTFDVAGGR